MSQMPRRKKPFFQSDGWRYIRWLLWLPLTFAGFGLSFNLPIYANRWGWGRLPEGAWFGLVGLTLIFCLGFFAPKWKFRIALFAFCTNVLYLAFSLLTDLRDGELPEALGFFTGLLLGLILVKCVDRKPIPKKPERIILAPLKRVEEENKPGSDS